MKDRVVCIDDSKQSALVRVKKGEIYTVRSIEEFKGHDWYTFEEFSICHLFNPECYRPVDDSFGEWVEATVLQEGVLEATEKELV